jgi:hypothetical protein
MAFDFEALACKIEIATRKAFIHIQRQHPEDDIYAFALYSDDGAMTVCAAANSVEHLENADLDQHRYYKFEPAEWKYEGSGFGEADSLLGEICTIVRNRITDIDDDDGGIQFEEFQSRLYETCIEVLKKLHGEGFFKQICGNDVFVTFSVTEYEFERAKIREIISALNDNDYRDEYLSWMKTWPA